MRKLTKFTPRITRLAISWHILRWFQCEQQRFRGILEWGRCKGVLGILWSYTWSCWSPESRSLHSVTGHLSNQVDHENVRHACPFPSAPGGHFGLRREGRRGEKWEGMRFQVGWLFIQPLQGLFSMDAFSTIPLSSFPLPPPPSSFFAFVYSSPSFLPSF